MVARSVSESRHPCLSEGASCQGNTQREALGGQLRADRSTEGSKIFAVGTINVDRARSPGS